MRSLTAAASESPLAWSVAQLDVGDIQVRLGDAVALVIERKTYADAAASVIDGRYKEQKMRLLSCHGAAAAMYVYEGVPSYDAGASGRSSQDAVHGCMINTLVRDRLRVVTTRDVADTAALLAGIARRAQGARDPARYLLADVAGVSGVPGEEEGGQVRYASTCLRARKRDNVDARHCYLQQLAQVPGVSVRMAAAIAAEYGCMRALFDALLPLPSAARVKTLARLPTVGVKSAGALDRVFFGLPEESAQ
jgi:ERCC4-type nuclease